jgi:hypothetical protein
LRVVEGYVFYLSTGARRIARMAKLFTLVDGKL